MFGSLDISSSRAPSSDVISSDVITPSDVTAASLQPMVLMGHEGGVWSCEVADGRVVSGSTDRTLKVSIT